MQLSVVSSMSRWLSQIVTAISQQMTRMQPEQYAIGLVVCIGLGYVLLRSRD